MANAKTPAGAGLTDRTATELLRSLANGEVSAEELTGSFLDSIRQRDDRVRAFLHVDEDGAREGEDEVPETPEDPVSRPGDLWLLGPHRLLCGDATVITDLDRLMAGQKADLCFTDSPYNVDYSGGAGAEKAGKGRRIMNDALGDGFGRFLYDACVSIILHTAGAIYMCMSSSELPMQSISSARPASSRARSIAATGSISPNRTTSGLTSPGQTSQTAIPRESNSESTSASS